MEKEDFIAYALFFGEQANESHSGSRRYQLYMDLFTWSKAYYKANFIHHKSH